MSEVCRAFGISRKTGYKIFERYKEDGLEALTDRFAPAGSLTQSAAATDHYRTLLPRHPRLPRKGETGLPMVR